MFLDTWFKCRRNDAVIFTSIYVAVYCVWDISINYRCIIHIFITAINLSAQLYFWMLFLYYMISNFFCEKRNGCKKNLNDNIIIILYYSIHKTIMTLSYDAIDSEGEGSSNRVKLSLLFFCFVCLIVCFLFFVLLGTSV